jgi:N6-adenosine-specific RNA methylase IME4
VTNLVWFKTRRDGGPDGRGVGFYFRNVTEIVLFGIRGGVRTLDAGRRQVNLFSSQKREHSRKPEQLYDIIEACSAGPYLELFARHPREGWRQWGNEVVEESLPRASARSVRNLAPHRAYRETQARLFDRGNASYRVRTKPR